MKIRVAATALCVCWWIAEYIRSQVRDNPGTKNLDKGSSKLWDIAHFVGVIGIIVGFMRTGRYEEGWTAICGIALMHVGVSVRWLAIQTLARYFTGKIRILEDQHLVQYGLYRYVRHPAYTGSLLAYLGMGLAFANWISIVLIFFPILLAALYRMRVEEKVLAEAFGGEYATYSGKTKRLLPGIY